MKYAKTLKENLQLIKEDTVVVIHTKNGKVDYIKKGSTILGPKGTTLVFDNGVDFKDFVGMDPKAAKDSLVKYSRFNPNDIIIEGCGKIEEARADGKVIRFDTFGGGLEVNLSREGFSLYGFGSGVVDYKKPGFTYEDMDEKTYRSLIADITAFANRFDKDVKDVMAKYGFKK